MTLHATLNAVISVSAIIMRIERHSLPTVTPEGLYGHTRRYWVRIPEGRASQLMTPAMAVLGGFIRKVCTGRSSGVASEPKPDAADALRAMAGWSRPADFVGRPDKDLAGSLAGRSVRHLIGADSQNSAAHVNF